MTIDDYIDAARPYLHHSCETAWAAAGEDEDNYIAMMNSFVAIMFINHSFDMTTLAMLPKKSRTNSSSFSTAKLAIVVVTRHRGCCPQSRSNRFCSPLTR